MNDPGNMPDLHGAIVAFVVLIMLLIALLLGGLYYLSRPRDDDKK